MEKIVSNTAATKTIDHNYSQKYVIIYQIGWKNETKTIRHGHLISFKKHINLILRNGILAKTKNQTSWQPSSKYQ